MAYCLVPISSARITTIQGYPCLGNIRLGAGAYWTARKLGGANVGAWYQAPAWGKSTTIGTFDNVSRDYGSHIGTRQLDPVLLVAPQPWGIVGTTLVSMCAREADPDGLHPDWGAGAGQVQHHDWCAGYDGDVPSIEITSGTWLVVETSGATAPGLFSDTIAFAAAEVLYEGTKAQCETYRAGL